MGRCQLQIRAWNGTLTREQVTKHPECSSCERSTNLSQWLHEACRGGHTEVARMLLEEGADVRWTVPGFDNRTALTAAVEAGCEPLVELLRAHEAAVCQDGVAPAAASKRKGTKAKKAVRRCDDTPVASTVVEEPAADDDMFSLGLPAPTTASCLPAPVPAAVMPKDAAVHKERKRKVPETPDDGVQDKRLQCRDCGSPFVFTADKQREFAQKGFGQAIRTRCDGCAKFKKNRFGAKLR